MGWGVVDMPRGHSCSTSITRMLWPVTEMTEEGAVDGAAFFSFSGLALVPLQPAGAAMRFLKL